MLPVVTGPLLLEVGEEGPLVKGLSSELVFWFVTASVAVGLLDSFSSFRSSSFFHISSRSFSSFFSLSCVCVCVCGMCVICTWVSVTAHVLCIYGETVCIQVNV